jgi:catechol 2,3-dioxygenase-like lactoylglutathione lyase family enzyme
MIRGIHHFGLTVRDVDASAAWYEEVLGFRRAGEFKAPDGTRRKVFLRHDGLQARLGLTQHRHGSQDAFDETRAGLDHLAFTVADRGNSTPGQRGLRTPVSSIPRSRRRTPYRAPPCSSSATLTTFSSSCSPSRRHRR